MRVLTFDNTLLAEAAWQLQGSCKDYTPDLVVGIASGGAKVSALMFAGISHIEVACRRSSTSKKENVFVGKVLRCMPYAVLDMLRMAESRMLSRRKPVVNNITLVDELAESIRKARRILVVDDAVDSGATLVAVLRALSEIAAADAEIRSPVITVTTDKPLITPDYYLYNNKTLIRFPWSKDSKTSGTDR